MVFTFRATGLTFRYLAPPSARFGDGLLYQPLSNSSAAIVSVDNERFDFGFAFFENQSNQSNDAGIMDSNPDLV
jgi:hypothetical protein